MYNVPGTVLGAGDRSVNKIASLPAWSLHLVNKQINEINKFIVC